MSNWMQDEDRIAEIEQRVTHEEFHSRVTRMKTITKNAVDGHRLKASSVRRKAS